MKKYSSYLYFLSFLSILIPTPGRFVFGFTICLELLLLTILGTLFNSLILKLMLEDLKTFLLITFLISFTILYRQIFVIFQTQVALVMSILFYFPPLSLFLIHILSKNEDFPLLKKIEANGIHILLFFVMGLLFFLIRDVFIFGTFTFYGKNHQIYEKVIFNFEPSGFFSFAASIPGALILFAIILVIIKFVMRKFEAYENLEAQNALS